MVNLLLGILFFNLILIAFKLFEKYKVDNLQAIVVNYIVASGLGFYFSDIEMPVRTSLNSDWLVYALSIGVFFVIVFNLLAQGAQKVGLAISTVANKMSVIIPVIFAFIVFGDTVSILKVAGILIALVGVYFTSTNGKNLSFDKKYLWLILIIFIGQGVADCIFQYAQRYHVPPSDAKIFLASMFGAACITGSLMLAGKLFMGQSKLALRNVLWGVILGVPNFLTVYYFFRALESNILEASQVYPILNMGVIVLSALSGLILFGEKLSKANWVGVILSIIAIAAITFG